MNRSTSTLASANCTRWAVRPIRYAKRPPGSSTTNLISLTSSRFGLRNFGEVRDFPFIFNRKIEPLVLLMRWKIRPVIFTAYSDYLCLIDCLPVIKVLIDIYLPQLRLLVDSTYITSHMRPWRCAKNENTTRDLPASSRFYVKRPYSPGIDRRSFD